VRLLLSGGAFRHSGGLVCGKRIVFKIAEKYLNLFGMDWLMGCGAMVFDAFRKRDLYIVRAFVNEKSDIAEEQLNVMWWLAAIYGLDMEGGLLTWLPGTQNGLFLVGYSVGTGQLDVRSIGIDGR
jgi:hypothetical protein